MNRKWTLDRIEFDNETYTVTRPDTPETSAQVLDPCRAAAQLGLRPATSAGEEYPGRPPFPPALIVAKADTEGTDSRRPRRQTPPRRLH